MNLMFFAEGFNQCEVNWMLQICIYAAIRPGRSWANYWMQMKLFQVLNQLNLIEIYFVECLYQRRLYMIVFRIIKVQIDKSQTTLSELNL